MLEIDLDAISKRCEAATAGEWKAYRFVDDDGQPLRGDAAKKYVADCIDKGGDDFYGVVCERGDGPADVCHTGNGPTSDHHAAFIAHARTDLPALVEEVKRLREALRILAIDANRLCDRNLGGTYEDDCRRSLAAARAALGEPVKPEKAVKED